MNAMKPIFKTFFLSLAVIANIHFAYAQTQGGIIPNGLNVFLDNNGKPLSSGKVFFYTGNTGSTVPKTTYSDLNLTIPNTNPVILDAAGRPNGSKGLWGTGNYRQQVFDKNNNLIWDVLTNAAGSGSGGGGGTATGDGDLVGTVKPWAGMIAPNQYMFTYGQEVARATYPALFTAITSLQNVFCTSASPILTGVGDTTNFWIGMSVEIGCTVTGNSTVVSKTSSTVTLADNSNITTSAAATFFSWGDGNKTTTFNLPDFRGLIPMGNNIMGGTASSNISDANFGTPTPESAGGQGGTQTTALAANNIPSLVLNNIIPGLNVPVTNSSITDKLIVTGSGSDHAPTTGGSWSTQAALVPTYTNSSLVSISRIPPTKTVNFIIKVTPDSNSATASGVTSLGLMTGDIACGSGLICTGNIISVGNIPAAQTSVLGGVLAVTCATSNWFHGLTTGTGAFICTQPTFTDLSGTLSLSQGGTNANLTASNGGIFWSNATQAQILAGTATARLPLLSGATATPVWGAFTIPSSVTSGGILCFTSTSVSASSVLETANALILGGGAGVCPSPLASLGTTATVLHGNVAGAPTFAAIVSADMNITATNCTNQFVSAISTGGIGTCTTAILASAQFANQGTTTTLLHGNAAGNPSFTSVVSADLNITTTSCTNQFLTAISATGVGTCTTDVLASAQHANQGTTTTVLHGNAAGNPSFAQVALSTDISGLGTGVATAAGTALSSAGGLTTTIASGTSALGTGAITSATCATVVTTSATNTATTDVITASFNGDPTAVTGYIPSTSGMLTIFVYPTANNVNFKVCNNTANSVTPGAITLNWRVVR